MFIFRKNRLKLVKKLNLFKKSGNYKIKLKITALKYFIFSALLMLLGKNPNEVRFLQMFGSIGFISMLFKMGSPHFLSIFLSKILVMYLPPWSVSGHTI